MGGQVSTLGDVYSYGILLLELFTGKRPIEESAIIKDHLVNVNSRIKVCLISVLRIGLSCSTTSWDERVSMNVVVNEMNAIRDTFLKYKMRKQKKKELGMLTHFI